MCDWCLHCGKSLFANVVVCSIFFLGGGVGVGVCTSGDSACFLCLKGLFLFSGFLSKSRSTDTRFTSVMFG